MTIGWLSLALGALILVMGTAHSVAITATAFRERGGLDGKWAGLLSLGASLMLGGAAMVFGGWRLLRGDAQLAWVPALAAAFLVVHMVVAAPFFSPWPAILYGLYLVAWWFLGRPLLRN